MFKLNNLIKFILTKKNAYIIGLILLFLYLVILLPCSLSSFIGSIIFFFSTLIFYFARLFGISNAPLLFNFYNTFIAINQINIGETIKDYSTNFFNRLVIFFQMIFSKSYFEMGLSSITNFGRIILLLITAFIILYLIYKISLSIYFNKSKDKEVGYTKSYLFIDNINKNIINTIKSSKDIFTGEVNEKTMRKINITLIFFILLFSNTLSLLINIYCYLLILVVSFNLESIYWGIRNTQVFFIHLNSYIPLTAFIVILFVIYNKYRKYRAFKKLQKYEEKNEDFADKLGIIISILGFPGSGKTTMAVSLMQIYEKEFRDKAYDIMMKYRNKFLEFNWSKYNLYLVNVINDNNIKNRVQLRNFLKIDLVKQVNNDSLFDYRLERKLTEYDGLVSTKLEEALITYAEAYYYYSSSKPRAYANNSILFKYSIDNNSNDSMPIFNYKYLIDDNKLNDEDLHRSSLLDMDLISLGKKADEKTGAIDSGIVFLTEKDKEFGNRLTNSGVSRLDKKLNVYNRLSDVYLMLCRHLHTIDSQPFFKYINDYQRSGSVSVSYEGITETTILVDSANKYKLCYPNWIIGRSIYEFFINGLENFFKLSSENRQKHGILEWFLIKIYNFLSKIYYYRINSFTITKKHVSVQGHADDMPQNYYYIWKEIYSGVFKTDCYRDFFEVMYSDPDRLFDTPEAKGDYLNKFEYDSLHSLFINKLENYEGLKSIKELNLKKEQKKENKANKKATSKRSKNKKEVA